MSEPVNQDETIGADKPIVGAANADETGGYEVGRGRPPKEHQWKKGQSGNPRGRPRKKLDQNAVFEQIMNERIMIREGGKARKITKGEALVRSQLAKAIKGDTRAAEFVVKEAARWGFGIDQDSCASVLLPPSTNAGQSDALFANLNLDLLSEEDKIELARLGQIIDLGGDFTALSQRDFEGAKRIADKGRDKDVTAMGDTFLRVKLT
jgi:hypothetical protein